jgi:hypothetical protein
MKDWEINHIIRSNVEDLEKAIREGQQEELDFSSMSIDELAEWDKIRQKIGRGSWEKEWLKKYNADKVEKAMQEIQQEKTVLRSEAESAKKSYTTEKQYDQLENMIPGVENSDMKKYARRGKIKLVFSLLFFVAAIVFFNLLSFVPGILCILVAMGLLLSGKP